MIRRSVHILEDTNIKIQVPSKEIGALMEKHLLLKYYPWSEVYTWHFIETGYRTPVSSCVNCFRSLLYPHNEFVNAQSHIIGSLWVLYLMSCSIYNCDKIAPLMVMMLYLLASFFMCFFSATYHIFCCHSDNMCKTVQCFDWLGKFILILNATLMS